MEAARKYDEIYKQPELDAPLTKGRFQGKVAIVTGAAQGIGRTTVERFCNDGASVAIFDLNGTMGRSFEAKMISLGLKAKFYEVDVTNKDQCAEAVKMVADDNDGMVHFLVNCAAFQESLNVPFLDVSNELFNKTLDVNVIGIANMVQACFPYMKKDGSQCAVVNAHSIRGHAAALHQSAYSTSKGALNMLTKCMALDLSSHGIRVNGVSPGGVWTPAQALNGCTGRDDAFERRYSKLVMTPRSFIESAGVASVITFLCSQDAMYIDGADIPVDCGYLAMGPEGPGH